MTKGWDRELMIIEVIEGKQSTIMEREKINYRKEADYHVEGGQDDLVFSVWFLDLSMG